VKRYFLRFDSGWLYIVAGCLLLWAAIVLPAKQELEHIQERVALIEEDREHLAYRIHEYESFIDQLIAQDANLITRVIQMQTSGAMRGEFVVYDPNAAKTPLQWLERKTAMPLRVIREGENPTLLEGLTSKDRRLWIAGFGGFALFVGLLQSPRQDT
jgi:hypothetical protein